MLNLRIGLLLGIRHIQRTSKWASLLIIFVVVCTFINLVAVSGILGGIIEGALREIRSNGVGDIIISPLDDEDRVLETERIERELEKYPQIEAYSARYKGFATIEANYSTRRDLSSARDINTIEITGIDPEHEDATLNLSSLINEGEYLGPNDLDGILIGKLYIDRYAKEFGDIYNSFENVYPGDKVRVTIGDTSKEFTVRGIVDSKIDFVMLSVYIHEKEFRRLSNRTDRNAEDIVVRLVPSANEVEVQEMLKSTELYSLGKIDNFFESIPKYVRDVEDTFSLLGLFIGVIGIMVASITVFIIIFINILTRKRQIGILKAIGISRKAIQYAYMTQSLFYATAGSLIGLGIVVFGLVPYFDANPIDFPYSDVSLETSVLGLTIRVLALCGIMAAAGLIPAWLITRQNTLSAILGRKK